MKHVKGFIRRKSMLYKTGVEYGDYTMNHVLGCAHGCKFPCYAFMMKKRFGQVKTYEEWLEPHLVENTLELLEEEIPRLRDRIESVELCFTTDPFMYEYDEIRDMSLAAIRLLKGCAISYLTNNQLKQIEEGRIIVTGHDTNGSLEVSYAPDAKGHLTMPW